LAKFSHAIYIDESGNAANSNDIARYWVTAAFAVDFEHKDLLDQGIRDILVNNFDSTITELKGHGIPRDLKLGKTSTDVAQDLADLWDQINANAWVVGTSYGVNVPPGVYGKKIKAKDIARQLMLERLNGFLDSGHLAPGHCLLIWDISERQELQDFSRAVSVFRDGVTNTHLNPRLAPAVLGGLSHDWSGLQAADLVSHYALHHLARRTWAKGSRQDKADDFGKLFMPRLQKDSKGSIVGWKIW